LTRRIVGYLGVKLTLSSPIVGQPAPAARRIADDGVAACGLRPLWRFSRRPTVHCRMPPKD